MPLIKKYKKIIGSVILKILPFKPSILFENENRKE
jgi:hypothetical protein